MNANAPCGLCKLDIEGFTRCMATCSQRPISSGFREGLGWICTVEWLVLGMSDGLVYAQTWPKRFCQATCHMTLAITALRVLNLTIPFGL